MTDARTVTDVFDVLAVEVVGLDGIWGHRQLQRAHFHRLRQLAPGRNQIDG